MHFCLFNRPSNTVMNLFRRLTSNRSDDTNDDDSSGGIRDRGPDTAIVRNDTRVFRVRVPENTRPGDEFQVLAGARMVLVTCPPDSQPGQLLNITIRVDPSAVDDNNNHDTIIQGGNRDLPPDSSNVRLMEGSDPVAYMVTIPDNVRGGQQFPVTIQGQELMVDCPLGARSGMMVRIVPPPPPNPPSDNNIIGSDANQGGERNLPPNSTNVSLIEGSNPVTYIVTIPENVGGGQQFPVTIQGQELMVTCPLDTRPGMMVRIVPPPPPRNVVVPPSDNSSIGSNANQGGERNILPDSSNVSLIEGSNPVTYIVTIPENVGGGQQFPVTIQGQELMVTCPLNTGPGMSVRIVPPPPPNNLVVAPSDNNRIGSNVNQGGGRILPPDSTNVSLIEGSNPVAYMVTIPENVGGGQRFPVTIQGQEFMVACPLNTRPGMSVRIVPPPPSNNLVVPPSHNNSIGSNVNQGGGRILPPDSTNVSLIEGSNPAAYTVTIPENVGGGQQFPVTIQGQELMVTCPLNARPGTMVRILPPPPSTVDIPPSDNNSIGSNANQGGGRILPPDSTNVSLMEGSNPAAYMVTIPENVRGGQQFPVTIQGQELIVTCPLNTRPGMSVRIIPPPPPPPRNVNMPPSVETSTADGVRSRPDDEERMQTFQVTVPEGVRPGAPFALLASGVRVLVTCPPNAQPGQRIQFRLPLALTQTQTSTNELEQIKMKYGKDGWTRTVRATDLKFQWIRMDDNGEVDLNKRFNFEKSAYVRTLEFRTGENPFKLMLVPASEAVMDSKIKSADDRELVTYSDLANAQAKNFEDKVQWFHDTCQQLRSNWDRGHIMLRVRRDYLCGDSIRAVMSLSPGDLRKIWRFEFLGEEGRDAGGLTREWFELVCKQIFDPDMGLWMSSTTNQMSMTINPGSGTYPWMQQRLSAVHNKPLPVLIVFCRILLR